MTNITTVGLDLAKMVFQVHGADAEGRPVVRKKLRRGKLLGFFADLSPCLIGLEACAGAHYWARELQALGHEVRLREQGMWNIIRRIRELGIGNYSRPHILGFSTG